MTMAVLADWRTGVGTASQATIASAVGCSDRHVRQLLTTLSERKDSPVIVTRQRRSAPNGSGRTSDQYTLELFDRASVPAPATPSVAVQPEQHSGREPAPNRNSVPVEEPFQLQVQPEQHDRSTGTARPFNRNARSDDQISSDLSQISSSAPRQVSRPKKQPKARAEKAPVEGAHELKLHYVAEFKRARTEEPEFGKGWGRAVKAFGDMVTAHGLEKAKRIVSAALAAQYGSKTPWDIRDKAVNYQGTQPSRGRAPEPQRSPDQERSKSWGRETGAPF